MKEFDCKGMSFRVKKNEVHMTLVFDRGDITTAEEAAREYVRGIDENQKAFEVSEDRFEESQRQVERLVHMNESFARDLNNHAKTIVRLEEQLREKEHDKTL